MMNRKMKQEYDSAKFLEEAKVQVKNIISYHNYFLSQKDYLLANFKEKYVAIGEGGLMGSDNNKRSLQKRIYEKHGNIQVFIEKIEENRFQKELPGIWLDEEFDILTI